MKYSCLALVLCFVFSSSFLFAQSNVRTATLSFTTIDVPGSGCTTPGGINSKGTIVGYYSADGGAPHKQGFAYDNGVFTYFDYPGAWATFPTDIDDSGTIVGFSQFNGGLTASGFFYDGANFNLFNDGNNSFTAPYAINNAGLVVGGAGSINASRGFEMKGRQFKPVRFPGPNVAAYATGINSFGEVTGFGDYHAYLYRNGTFLSLDFPGAFATVAWGINDHHVIVGWYAVTGVTYGFALKGGTYLSFSYPGAVGTFPTGINSAGQIVGQYTFDNKFCHGFLTSLPTLAEDYW